ncbi:carbamate kinase [Virgibacillus pantothenticus]|uniref:Carbamate kinase n=1 Tax=Virgibacillus pantothenticus TaxID=1473 RepID=A0A0L0QLI2_VIRPA|nr:MULTISPECIES: carbamate kinase [Virgibacillus]API93126.1 carbamate kinase [Virgibacillus sp. 6R]KNE19421.1 carbamate kinase [Virgibacillus pantothenticus]MBS7428838.1 carbamate kinase [Virgibacillus sp. 19R1-5]MBU8568456.1 carbamate kinase [Virgibacillus pantothenticus]MBU8602453.1 carbamate kinase [Virgibacillus pantothenticus]
MGNERIVIALGGNAIQSGSATAEAQQEALNHTAKQLIEIIKQGYQVAITHGNGPQVGNILLQQIQSHSEQTPAMPLDTCGAMSQGMIGYWLENAINDQLHEEGLDKQVASVITRVEVNPDDKAFSNPSKPIGPFYSEKEAKEQMEKNDVTFKEDAGRGWRRVVPSPKPVKILEHEVIKSLVDNGMVVVSTGGGGIPVYRKDNKILGVEAVIDKDFASEKLAELIQADKLVILTEVEHVYVNYQAANQKALEQVTTEELRNYAEEGQFSAGSMLPKVEAAIAFVESKPGSKCIITSLDKAVEAVNENAGTVIKNH